MPQDVTLYRILIASPGDCSHERQILPKIISEWNAAHTLSSGIILEPVLWESHSIPELGGRPQDAINRQLVDSCDIVVGVFWTRLGTPTGEAPSGTAEEIEIFRRSGKRVLLYFSQAAISPNDIDLTQYNALRAYQQQVRNNGLTFTYSGIIDFQALFSRQLAGLMAEIVSTGNTQRVEEVLGSDVASVATHSNSDSDVIKALESIRHRTRFFWEALKDLSPYNNEFTAEIKEETFTLVKPSLDVLVANGHFTYLVEHAYNMVVNNAPVLSIAVRSVTAQIKNLARHLATKE